MLTLKDGRKELYQWDTGRTAIVNKDCDEVHFSNMPFGTAYVVEVKNGEVAIPDELLMATELYCWAFVGSSEDGYTREEKVFKINKRPKPSDYVFTPTEQITLDKLLKEIEYGIYDGATFIPNVSTEGIISWDNDKGLKNPIPVNIKGPKGNDGISIESVEQTIESNEDNGENVITVTKSDKTESTFVIKNGSRGEKGEKGNDSAPIIETKSGIIVTVEDAANTNIIGVNVDDESQVDTVKVIGKNFFNRDYNDSVSNIGVVVEWDSENQEFILNGTTTAPGDIKLVTPLNLDWEIGEKYTVSVCKVSGTATLASGTSTTTYAWGIFQDDASKFMRGATGNSAFLETYNFTANAFPLGEKRTYIFYFQCWRPGTKFENYRVKVQIEKGELVTNFEKYRENYTSLEQANKLILEKGYNNIFTVPRSNITIQYSADAKMYIDNKFAELEATLISLGGNV